MKTTPEQRAEAIDLLRNRMADRPDIWGDRSLCTAILDELDARASRIKELEADLDEARDLLGTSEALKDFHESNEAGLSAALHQCVLAIEPSACHPDNECFEDCCDLKKEERRHAWNAAKKVLQ